MELDLNDYQYVSGSDPGIVATTTTTGKSVSSYLQDTNRFKALYCEELEYDDDDDPAPKPDPSLLHIEPVKRPLKNTSKSENHGTFSTLHRRKREKRERSGRPLTQKELDKDRRAREVRTKKYYGRLAARLRDFATKRKKKRRCIHFFGNWTPRNCPIGGHARRGTKKLEQALASAPHDKIERVDEYASSKTCPYCFADLIPHTYNRTGNQRKKVNGAKFCCNPECPSRRRNCSTINRDAVGAQNIALIGMTMALARDGLPLPPFRRSVAKTTRAYLEINYNIYAAAPTGKIQTIHTRAVKPTSLIRFAAATS